MALGLNCYIFLLEYIRRLLLPVDPMPKQSDQQKHIKPSLSAIIAGFYVNLSNNHGNEDTCLCGFLSLGFLYCNYGYINSLLLPQLHYTLPRGCYCCETSILTN